MKKIVFLCVLCTCLTYAVFAQAAKGGTLYTATKSVALKSSTGFFANTKGTLEYGDQVSVLQVNGKWVEVSSAARPSVSGWAATANFSARRITGSSASASASEVALAGKGFTLGIDGLNSSGNQLNYDAVDKIEAITVSQNELHRFLTDGRLSTGN